MSVGKGIGREMDINKAIQTIVEETVADKISTDYWFALETALDILNKVQEGKLIEVVYCRECNRALCVGKTYICGNAVHDGNFYCMSGKRKPIHEIEDRNG